jgi:SagB-type dehydrogenase family enzyme
MFTPLSGSGKETPAPSSPGPAEYVAADIDTMFAPFSSPAPRAAARLSKPRVARAAPETTPLQPASADSGLTASALALIDILQRRASTRQFSARPLALPILSQLLWAAFGVNRPEAMRRTAPSAKNWQEIDIYVAQADGVHLFDAQAFALHRMSKEDVRAETGWQDYVPQAPLDLVYVANLDRIDLASREVQRFYSGLDTGFISQNVYLFCAAQGLATVVRGSLNRPALAKIMRLGPQQRIMAVQSVGYPV